MKKRYYILIILFQAFSFFTAYAQVNSWINFNQTYYRISIPKTGIYKLTKADLINAGIPVNNYDMHDAQLFFFGKQIPCYINANPDFKSIEFFATKNDGRMDTPMHDTVENILNPYYSLINDTASVFITWSKTGEHKRYTNITDNNFTDYNEQDYCWIEALNIFTNRYYLGSIDCEYTEGEGWADHQAITKGNKISKTIKTPNLYNLKDLKTEVEFSLLTFSSEDHHIKVSGAGFILDTVFYGYKTIKSRYSVPTNGLLESNKIEFSSVGDTDSETDKSVVAYIRMVYPSLLNFKHSNYQLFDIPASAKKSYLKISKFNHDAQTYIFDQTNNYRIKTTLQDDTIRALIPPSANKTKLIIVNEQGYLKADKISPCKFKDHSKGSETFIIITHPKIWSGAEQYKFYRNAYMVNINELYNQFAYGIQQHPMAIRNFTEHILKSRNPKPEFLFLIGKGVSPSQCRRNITSYKNNLVPTMGEPSSDVLLSANINGNKGYSSIATGRLSVLNNKDVINYLNKVKEFEANTPAEWMKRAIHFGGGKTSFEKIFFKSCLEGYEGLFVNGTFGGYVSSFFKTTSSPIEITKSDSIENLINGGVSLITFFGHGNTNGFDQSIDDPQYFHNKGKYPLLIANSCYSGNIFRTDQNSASEDWTLIPNKGTIGFLAVIHEGHPFALDKFTRIFYKRLSTTNYGEPLGKIINQTQKQIITNNPNALQLKNTVQEFTLHADPSIVINSFSLPDLVIKNSQIQTIPSILNTQIDSFDLKITLKNISRAIVTPFKLQITRTHPNNEKSDTIININKIGYKKDIIVRYPIKQTKGTGTNSFFIKADSENIIDEISETNNSFIYNVLISSSDLIATTPYEYSLNPTPPKFLTAICSDINTQNEQGVFQIDTKHTFNSPNLKSQTTNYSAGVTEWEHKTTINESEVYFWRVGSIGNNLSPKDWSESSFVYKKDETGWMQADFGQIKNNRFTLMRANPKTQQYEFKNTPKRLSCYNIGSPSNAAEMMKIKYSVDGVGDYAACEGSPSLVVVVIDTINLTPWKSKRKNFGQRNYPSCRSRDELYFIFRINTENLDSLSSMLKQIPDGFHTLIYSFNKVAFSSFSNDILTELENFGMNNIRFIGNNIPYIFYTQKGRPSTIKEVIGTSPTDNIKLDVNLQTNIDYGSITSVKIGPSKQWQSVNWQAKKLEANPNETFYVSVDGITELGEVVSIMDSIGTGEHSLTSVSSNKYPYLQLNFHTHDKLLRTPSQLQWWKVNYLPATDLTINPNRAFSFNNDTLSQGEEGQIKIAIENIGATKSDSVIVKYWLQDSNNKTFTLSQHTLKPLNAGEFVIDSVTFKTDKHFGNMRIWIEVNPWSKELGRYYQPEKHRFNNIISKTFFIQKDITNPLLDVTFDGTHIMDGDIVSAKPEILITLDDDNPYFPLTDTANFLIYIKSQSKNIEEQIPINGNSKITFIPAHNKLNKAKIIYHPHFKDDGIYELRVKAKDQSGNLSGKNDYNISFRVINESTITNVFNYPNPFSTSTKFVFELTGSKIPDEFRIDILTVSGRVVKVIYQDELGDLLIGRNITQYAWDGCDMYGKPLANGVYFYKVTAKINGKPIKLRNTNTSKFFKNGFGKLYIMR